VNDSKLTIDQANRIADGLVTVSVDPIDAELWRVEDDDAVQAHEPMAESEWQRFLAEWGGVDHDPAEDVLADALRDNLSPSAIAGIIACLKPACTPDPDANRQIDWFRRLLADMVGADGGDGSLPGPGQRLPDGSFSERNCTM